MMARIENVEMTITPQDCKKVLVALSLAYRPLILSELAVLSGLAPEITQAAVEESGSSNAGFYVYSSHQYFQH
jgi:hypothetical protein